MAEPRRTHDPTVLRAIAHPVRNRVLQELGATGPMRAADLAEALGIPANQASFHLRQLAKYGLVEPSPETGRDRRDRYWRPAEAAGYDVDIGALARTPGGAAAAEVFRRDQAAWGHRVIEAAYAPPGQETGVYRSVTEQALRLTKAEAKEVGAEVGAVLQAWLERTRGRSAEESADPAQPDDVPRTYLYYGVVQPYPATGEPPAQ